MHISTCNSKGRMKVADVTSTSLPDFLSSHSFYHLSVFTVVLLVCGAFYVWSDSDSRRGGAFDVALPDETTWYPTEHSRRGALSVPSEVSVEILSANPDATFSTSVFQAAESTEAVLTALIDAASTAEAAVEKDIAALQLSVDTLLSRVRACAEGAVTEDERCDGLIEEARDLGARFVAIDDAARARTAAIRAALDACPDAAASEALEGVRLVEYLSSSHSAPLVGLSEALSELRRDGAGTKNEDEAQEFDRVTTKYLVRKENVARLKVFLIDHMPLFLYDKSTFEGDAQLISSVYIDNDRLDLHFSSVDTATKSIRLRWYGRAEPETVFVERKTRGLYDSVGELLVTGLKDRIALAENQVVPFMRGDLTPGDVAEQLRRRGKGEEVVEKFQALYTELQEEIVRMKLEPSVRTAYMRAAFQIPYDATVRMSLDTDVCMAAERAPGSPGFVPAGKWRRDPEDVPMKDETICFDDALLEIKLALDDGEEPPAWLTELLESGLVERTGFSKFHHGAERVLNPPPRDALECEYN